MKVCSIVLALTGLFAFDTAGVTAPLRDDVVVTNRGSGSISVIDAATHAVTTHPLPIGENPSEPMYANFVANRSRLYVGDRANNRVVVFDARDYSVLGHITVGAGVFHQWAEPSLKQVWVNNDVDKTISVIDTSSDTVAATIPTPADLNDAGGRPHDVILDPTGPFAYITMIGVAGVNDYVVKYSTETFLEVDRAPVGKDPHLSLSATNNLLYVPTQNAHEVRVLDRGTLDFVTSIPVPTAHGAGMAPDGQHFYTTSIGSGGVNGLLTIGTGANSVVDADSTPFGTPHNIAVSPDGLELFLTHSGATSTAVSIYNLGGIGSPSNPVFDHSVNAGLNPWGVTAFAVVPEPGSAAIASVTFAVLSVCRLRRRHRAALR